MNPGGLVAGKRNLLGAEHASVVGGTGNDASGSRASILEWRRDFVGTARRFASISGGQDNVAAGESSLVSGGREPSDPGPFDWRAGCQFEDD